MTTLNGFLGQPLGSPPQMTKGQKALLLKGARAALEAAFPPLAAAGLLAALQGALEAIPDATPCAGCDFCHPGTWNCTKWGSEIPPEWRAVGCEAFQDEGAPF